MADLTLTPCRSLPPFREAPRIFRYDEDHPDPVAWAAFLAARDSGAEVEIDQGMYFYWLEVLPPVFMHALMPWPEARHPLRYDFGFAEGAESITVFWRSPDGTRYFCQRTTIRNPWA